MMSYSHKNFTVKFSMVLACVGNVVFFSFSDKKKKKKDSTGNLFKLSPPIFSAPSGHAYNHNLRLVTHTIFFDVSEC